MKSEPKEKRDVFVIMPFRSTPTRNASDLTEFFLTNLKNRIENEDTFLCRYVVRRSDDAFDITAQIIKDLYSADIVLCDLSGHEANPNVMYELGVRLALTNKPVILFREISEQNRPIFDIQGFYAFQYSPHRYRALEDYLVKKISALESKAETYESPVFSILRSHPDVIGETNRRKVVALLAEVAIGMLTYRRAIGGEINDFLASHGQQRLQCEAMELLKVLADRKEDLADLPWDAFSFQPAPFPALDAMMSGLPLMDHIPSSLFYKLQRVLHEFYFKFLSHDKYWRQTTFWSVLTFVRECAVIGGVIMDIHNYFELDNARSPDELDKAAGMLDESIAFAKRSTAGSAMEKEPTRREQESPNNTVDSDEE